MKEYLTVLRRCPLFSGIDETDLMRMLECLGARVVKFDKKYTVMAEGSPAKYIGIVLSGSLQLSIVDYYGNRSIIGNASPSEVFAESFACAELKSIPIYVIANEESDVMFIDSSHIMHTCHNNCGFHQALIFNLMKDIATKAIQFHKKLEIVSKRTTRDKLMCYLMLEAKRANSSSFDIPYDRQELADYLDVDRSGLSVEIGKLRREGIIKSEKKHFELL